MAITEIENAIYEELFEIKDFQNFFIAVCALKKGLRKGESTDLVRAVGSDAFVNRFGKTAISLLILDIETERVLPPIEAPSPVVRVRVILDEYEID
jgi:hypothetical protein